MAVIVAEYVMEVACYFYIYDLYLLLKPFVMVDSV